METRKARISEDWLSVWIGFVLFSLSLGVLAGVDLLGWAVTTNVWMNLSRALAPVSQTYAGLPGWVSLILTYVFLLVLLSFSALALGSDLWKFAKGFSAILAISYGCWFLGSWAYIAATPEKLSAFGIS